MVTHHSCFGSSIVSLVVKSNPRAHIQLLFCVQMPLLRAASYNLGVNITDKKKGAQLSSFFPRLQRDRVDLVMLQEVRPYVGQAYRRHAAVEMALNQAPYTFVTSGNCASGGAEFVSSTSCHQFPGSNLDKYYWRAFSKAVFRHADLLVTVINSHTRAGGGTHDTSDSHRIEVLRRCREEVIKERDVSDLVIVAGDFNMLRPWKADIIRNFEAEMSIAGIQTFFKHSAPDHLVCYITNGSLQVNDFRTSPIQGIGMSHDGIGDHEGLLVDLDFSLPVVSAPETVVMPTSPQLPALPFVAKVIKPWVSIGGGYMSLQEHAFVAITYTGDLNMPDESGWCFGTTSEEGSGWFPSLCIKPIIAFKALSDWSIEDGGYLTLNKGDTLEMLYKGVSDNEIGWIYAKRGSQAGWCPLHLIQLWTTPRLALETMLNDEK